jgi:hypothetical protein
LDAKNDVDDSLHFAEPLRVQIEGHLDVFVVGSGPDTSPLRLPESECRYNCPPELTHQRASYAVVFVDRRGTPPAHITHRLAQRLPRRHRPRCRGSAPCSQFSWLDWPISPFGWPTAAATHLGGSVLARDGDHNRSRAHVEGSLLTFF